MRQYLLILIDSLDEKISELEEIESLSRKQADIIKLDEGFLDTLDDNMEAKAKHITKILALDENFDSIYNDVKDELMARQSEYKEEIASLQGHIVRITDRITAIEVIEQRNKVLIEERFCKERSSIGERRISSKAATDYYRNMNSLNVLGATFMDQKK